MADQGKTEQPTQRRLEKARHEGQFPSAKEFVSALQFLIFLAVLSLGAGRWFADFQVTARTVLAGAFQQNWTATDLTRAAWQLAWRHFLPLALGGMTVASATVMVRLLTTRFGLSLKRLAPDPSRLSPIAKLKELPRQNLPNLIQAAVLLPLFVWAVYVVARDKIESFLTLPLQSVESGFGLIASSLMDLFWKAGAVFLVFGSADLYRQLRRYRSDLRMSKQEIREEMKDTEGNPQIKGRIRRIQRDHARRRMMKEVPKATAVVVNPTHFAVAIRYNTEDMAAPKVVAKGKNYLAQRIRQIAIENQVPIVENAPLAQALYKTVEVGQEIPAHLYRAVAEILAYIFKLMNGRLPG